MGSDWEFLKPAAIVALIMAPLHAAFGLHVIRRGVIFIDLAVAQVAALGMALAMARGVEPDSPVVYYTAVGSALFGSLLISLTRFKLGKIPHEAMIGIIFVLGSAGSIITLQYADHGQELLQTILDGQILFVMDGDIKRTAIVYGVLAVVGAVMWKMLSKRSENKESTGGARETVLDFVFYALIGVMVASSVQIAGVLVVFTWLVMPAVVAWMWADKMSTALLVAIPLSCIGSLAGLWLSMNADEELGGWPTGASMVLAFGAIVAVSYVARLLIPARKS